jgi:hypothetical protein
VCLIRNVLIAGVGVVALAGCTLLEKDLIYRCPAVFILEDAKALTRFKAGLGRDITDILFDAEIVNFQGDCGYDANDSLIDVNLLVEIQVERGAANSSKNLTFDYFVAIPTFQSRPEGKQILPVTGSFKEKMTKLVYRDELSMKIPISNPVEGEALEIVLGFQLTPEELNFNRSRLQR